MIIRTTVENFLTRLNAKLRRDSHLTHDAGNGCYFDFLAINRLDKMLRSHIADESITIAGWLNSPDGVRVESPKLIEFLVVSEGGGALEVDIVCRNSALARYCDELSDWLHAVYGGPATSTEPEPTPAEWATRPMPQADAEQGGFIDHTKLTKIEKGRLYSVWEQRDRTQFPPFDVWSERTFGASVDADLNVPRSTFSGWKKYKNLVQTS